jgi:hypothetical protein
MRVLLNLRRKGKGNSNAQKGKRTKYVPKPPPITISILKKERERKLECIIYSMGTMFIGYTIGKRLCIGVRFGHRILTQT